jgi:hypothetical protein
MGELLSATIHVYRLALQATWRSLVRGWLTILALVGFGVLFLGAARIAGPLGMVGGLVLGLVNAVLVGATLRLIERALNATRTIQPSDVMESFGHYFWDVISVGFVLWLPMMALDMGVHANPYGQFLSSAALLLVFVLLNPAPEVIYQARHDSPLEVIKTSYEFVLEHWIEWFLPFVLLLLPVVLSPTGLSEFVEIFSGVGRGAGLGLIQFLLLPFAVIGSWLAYVGLDPEAQELLLFVLTPPAATAILLFRGHLFALLRGASRRQRLFARRAGTGVE